MGDENKATSFSAIWAWYSERVTSVGTWLSNLLGLLAALVFRRTRIVVIVSFLLMIICAIGWLNFDIETDGDKLWVPQHTKSKEDGKYAKSMFGSSTDASMFIVSPKAGGGDNIASLETTWEIFQLDKKIRNLSVSSGGKQYKYSDICFKEDSGACRQIGYLNFWNMSFPQYLQSVNGSETDPTKGNLTRFFDDINRLKFPDGQSVSTLSIFGGVQFSRNPIRVTSSKAIMVVYPVDRKTPTAARNKWMNKYLDTMESEVKASKYYVLNYFSGGLSVDNEISASVNKDLYLVAIAIVVFIIVAVVCMSKRSCVETRSSLAAVGLLSAVFAMLAGYGLSLGFGLPFTTLQQTLPFILLGVSVDVMIILTVAYDDIVLEDPSLTMQDRFIHTMKTAGMSVFVTTFASALAFALGTITALPAIVYFSAYATLSVATIFLSQVTFFLGIFIMTERRIAARKADCCCCLSSNAGLALEATPPPTAPSSTPPGVATMDANAAAQVKVNATKAVGGGGGSEEHSGLVSRLFDRYYAPYLLWWPTRIFVVLAFVGFAAFSAWAFGNLRQGQPLEELAPDDSYLNPFIKINRATFEQQLGPETSLFFRGFDQSTPAAQAKMLRALDLTLHRNSYVNVTISAFQDNWLMALITYAAQQRVPLDTSAGCRNPYVGDKELTTSIYSAFLQPEQLPGCIPQDQFYPLLGRFLSDKRYKEFSNKLARNPDGTIHASLFGLYHTASRQRDDFDSKLLEAVRESERQVNKEVFAADNAASKDGKVFFIWAADYNNGEGLRILQYETLLYAAMAITGVGFVMLLMLVHPLAALLMMLSVALVDLFLFAEMYIFDIRFNYVSVINMIMATGLAVDYSVYLAHKFMTTDAPTRAERMHIALKETGSAVFLGALTSLAGTIPLAFSSSTILRTFFALLFGTVIFAVASGLVLMPVLFATIGPAPLPSAKKYGKKATGVEAVV